MEFADKKIDVGIWQALQAFLDKIIPSLKDMGVYSIAIKKAHDDGSKDYWSYYLYLQKNSYSDVVEHHIRLSGYSNGEERSLATLFKISEEHLHNAELAYNVITNEEIRVLR